MLIYIQIENVHTYFYIVLPKLNSTTCQQIYVREPALLACQLVLLPHSLVLDRFHLRCRVVRAAGRHLRYDVRLNPRITRRFNILQLKNICTPDRPPLPFPGPIICGKFLRLLKRRRVLEDCQGCCGRIFLMIQR